MVPSPYCNRLDFALTYAASGRCASVRWHDSGSSAAKSAGRTAEPALARIEVAREELSRAFDLRDAIVEAGKRFGFAYVTLDLQGYRTGSHNEVLAGRSLRVV